MSEHRVLKFECDHLGNVFISDKSLDLLEERITVKVEKLFGEKFRELVDKRVDELVNQREFELYKENLELKNKLLERK